MLPLVITGGVTSRLVVYETLAALPQVSVAVTVMVAGQAPTVATVVLNEQLSVMAVAASAAASAAAAVA